MGMFDYVKCDYELPWPEAKDFGFEWQSKETDDQYLSRYEIRADGTLWHEHYDLRWEEKPDAFLGIVQHRDNPRWEQVQHTGELEIHHIIGNAPDHTWYSVLFWFRDGIVKDCVPKKTEPVPT
jgi:hypothetical protein